MNLRLGSNQLRLRLSPQDLEILSTKPQISECLKFGADEFSFRLEHGKEIELSAARISKSALKSEIVISLPQVEFLIWINSSHIEFEFEQSGLSVLIEKDLKPQRHL